MKRTDSQLRAINHENGNLVVTASAGSGKTSVMIERFLRLIVKRKARVKEILAVTFTTAAAAEMKEKLAKAIKELIAEGESVDYLRSELSDLAIADISTVHSFCSTIIRRYFYLVDVDPTFSVSDEILSSELSIEAINDVFDRLYESDDEDFYRLVKIFSSGRSDRVLKKIVLDIYEYASDEAYPEKFYDTCVFYYTEEGLKKVENEVIEGFLSFFKPMIEKTERILKECEYLQETKYIDLMRSMINGFKVAEEKRTEAALREFLKAEYVKENKGKKDSDFCRDVSDELLSIKRLIVKKAKEFDEYFEEESVRTKKSEEALKTVSGIIRLVKLYDEEFSRLKKERNLLDFSDLEHFTCRILQNEEAREEIASSYKYIFVDEYQDTNGAQEEIFSLLERENLFVVGDVKQSIYAFRGSKPEIFLERTKRAGENAVMLDSNFRSTKKVVDAVNNVFSRVMRAEICGVDYAKDKMIYGDLYKKEEGLARIDVVAKTEKTDVQTKGVYGVLKHLKEKSEEKPIGRAALVRKIIEETVGEEYYDEKGEKKRFSFGDIMIVSRKTNYRDVVLELIKSGIPVSSEAETELSDFYEINMLVDILTTVESSARDDVALLSTLKSGVASLTDEELLSVRNAYFGARFFEAVRLYSEEKSDELAARLKDFYSYLERLKLFSAFEGCSTLLRRVIDEKDLELHILSMPRGELKIKRVERFLSGLRGFAGEYTLAEFAAKKESILSKLKVAEPAGEDSVRVMTMHKSKGLEAPVVIVIGANSTIKGSGKQNVVLKSREYGLGVSYYDVEEKTRESTFMRRFISKKNAMVAVAEEMRVLYVALTRAKIRLHVIADSALKEDGMKAPCDAVKLIDFISPADMEYFERPQEEEARSDISRREPVLAGEDEDMAFLIEKEINASYPYRDDIKLSLKRTVTDVSRSTSLERYSEEIVEPFIITADVERGNAYHRFLELSSLIGCDVEAELEAFYQDGRLSGEERAVLDAAKLKKIVNNSVFAQFKDFKLYREQPFIVSVPPSIVGENGSSDVLLQGVIDLLAVKDGEAVIVDYKYSAKDVTSLKERYQKQLELYAFAVEKTLGLIVTKKVLFNINTGASIEV